jgi:hypothetical protein
VYIIVFGVCLYESKQTPVCHGVTFKKTHHEASSNNCTQSQQQLGEKEGAAV